uniref:Uncharacterized protein n=1 Tax=Neobodo designis TaxID=312471 RepID=A0A7S1PUS1_NEODS|mmetsp:Transcript_20376/g.63315  ORF Transcript_20376/g.63315 Transcript_20376/m.63315 type:complete len:446 (+) Transcript_20376:173-1510(+)
MFSDHHHHHHDHDGHHPRCHLGDAPVYAEQYHEQYASQYHMAEGPAACAVCLTQQVPFNGAACSRRCGWVQQGCCPQCGRGRAYGAPTVFCAPMCANQARQANWCVGCGVRQIPHGQQSCLMPACVDIVGSLLTRYAPHRPATAGPRLGRRGSDSSNASASTVGTASPSLTPPSGPVAAKASSGAFRSRRGEPHTRLAVTDKLFGAVRQQVGADVSKRLTAVIKAGGPAELRKHYTAYRCRVEQELNEVCGVGAPKFGHGGEGNEHRRFVPLTLACAGPAAADDHVTQTCNSSACQVCLFLSGGLSAAFATSESIPAYSTAAKALTASSATGVAAVIICRVTVGNPAVCLATDESDAADVPRIPLEDRVHSRVVKYAHHDVAHVPTSVVAADAQYLVLASAAPPVVDAADAAAPTAAREAAASTKPPHSARPSKKRGSAPRHYRE